MQHEQKHLFSLDPNVHYLNCAYMSPLLKSVEQVGREELEKRRNPQQFTLYDFFERQGDLKKLFSDLINVEDPNRIAIIPSVSYALANAANNVPKISGKRIIVLEGQFPSNYYIWKRICDEGNMSLITLPTPNSDEDWTNTICEAIDDKISAVCIPQVHWSDGRLVDLVEVGEACRSVDAHLVIDGTQSIGAAPFDNAKIQADVVISAGYKWLMGPYGIGLAYYGDKYDGGNPIEESWFAKEKSDEFSDLVEYQEAFRKGAWKYSVGESSNFIYVNMLIRSLEQIHQWSTESIQSHCRSITDPFVKEFESIGCQILDRENRFDHLFGLQMDKQKDLQELNVKLHERNIFVSIRGKNIRVSPHIYNTIDDMQQLYETLKSLLS